MRKLLITIVLFNLFLLVSTFEFTKAIVRKDYYQNTKTLKENNYSLALKKNEEKQSLSAVSNSQRRKRIFDERKIKTLLQQEVNLFNKGFKNLTDDDWELWYNIHTPNYKAAVSFQEFKESYYLPFQFALGVSCNILEQGPPLIINVKALFEFIYQNDPRFLNIKKEMSSSQYWEFLVKENPNLKEKMTVEEWNKIFPENIFPEKELMMSFVLCLGGKINIENIKIQFNRFSEGEWANVSYKMKFKLNNQDIQGVNIQEEFTEVYRKIGNRWYYVETDINNVGFNLADLPPDKRLIAKLELQQKEQERETFLQSEYKREEYKTSEIIEGLGKYIVKIACVNKELDLKVASGIIIGKTIELDGSRETNLILTNRHVVKDFILEFPYPCWIQYSSVPTKMFTDFYLASPVYFPSAFPIEDMETIDFDFLSIEEKADKELKIIPNASLEITNFFPRICNPDEIKVGESIVILGYPTAGGVHLTATEGIISGYDGDYYLITSAKIDKGNSGGGAFLKSTGCLVGMPTFAVHGTFESFARLINMSYLKQHYLSKIFQYK